MLYTSWGYDFLHEEKGVVHSVLQGSQLKLHDNNMTD